MQDVYRVLYGALTLWFELSAILWGVMVARLGDQLSHPCAICMHFAICYLLYAVCLAVLYYPSRLYRLCYLSAEEARNGRKRTAIEEEQDENTIRWLDVWVDV